MVVPAPVSSNFDLRNKKQKPAPPRHGVVLRIWNATTGLRHCLDGGFV